MFPPPPRVAITGSPRWAPHAESALRARGFEVVRCSDAAGYLDSVIDRFPALLLTDGDAADWSHWIISPKTEQGTRRVPVLTVTSSDWRAAQARDAGADVTLPIADLHRLPDLVAQYARTMDAETVARLRQQCRAALPPQGVEGIRRFNSGAFYAQHDIFEALWMAEPGPVRELYRVILQVGVAYYHIVRGNYLGGLKMLQRSAQWFAVLPDTCQGVDVRQLRQDAAAVRDVLRAAGPSGPRHFDRSLLKPVRLVSDGAGSTDC